MARNGIDWPLRDYDVFPTQLPVVRAAVEVETPGEPVVESVDARVVVQ